MEKDILEKLNEIALEASWGTVDRVYTNETPNGIPKALSVIQEAMEEIKRLRERNENLYDFKRKLEDELIENGFAEYADDKFKTLTDYKNEAENIRKETAKEIITDVEDRLTALCKQQGAVEEFHIKYIKGSMAETYGVKFDE